MREGSYPKLSRWCCGAFDLAGGVTVLESLKKRKRGVFRAVPVSPRLLAKLDEVHSIQRDRNDERLWPWSRMTGCRRVKEVMIAAGIEKPHASPKGLRHGFGVTAVEAGFR